MLCQIFDRESILLVDVILLFRFIMPNGKTAFAQIIDLVPDMNLKNVLTNITETTKPRSSLVVTSSWL